LPELPEVEAIVRGLREYLVGKKILAVEIFDKKRFIGETKKIVGQEISDIKRRAKVIIIMLKNKINIVIHLKMTGQLIFRDAKHKIAGGHQSKELNFDVPNNHTRIIFSVSGGGKLFYNDLIRYGYVKVLSNEDTEKITSKEFGPEPFSKDFSKEYFDSILKGARTANIKKILVDQKKIAGIGNIYSNESLYWGHINPKRKAISLSKKEQENLYDGILKALRLGIAHQGVSIRNYVDHKGQKGRMQDYFVIYGKAGEKCECGGLIKKIQLNGRGTYFCSACQR